MKKRILLSLLLLATTFAFAKDLFSDLMKQIQDTDLFYIYDSSARILPTAEETRGKISIKITILSKDEYTKRTNLDMDKENFPDKESFTFNEIKTYLRNGYNFFPFSFPLFMFMDYSWHDGKKISYFKTYSQDKKRISSGAGTYGYDVFYDDYVYDIAILDPTDVTERNNEYDLLTDLLYFKSGQKLDIERGLEQTQGYYFVNGEKSAQKFYQMLLVKDSSLPKSALKFQEAAEKLEEILNQY